MKEIDIYWNDVSEEIQKELLEAGFDNENITNGTFPLTTVFVEEEF